MLKLFMVSRLDDEGGREFRAIRELTAPESERYPGACQRLHEFHRTQDLIHLIAANSEEFRTAVDQLVQRAHSERRSAYRQDSAESRNLQRLVVNYLTATRLYLDHRQTFLTRRYGESSAVLAAFNATRRDIHEAHPEYRFLYELRNYVQHCGMPLQVVRVTQRLIPGDNSEAVHADVSIGFHRDMLLSEYGEWRHARSFIESQPPEFPALPIIERCTALFVSIERAVVTTLMPDVWADAKQIVSLLREVTDEHGYGQVAELTANAGQSGEWDMKLVNAPFDVLEWLKLITLLPGPPGIAINEGVFRSDMPPNIA